MEQCDFAQSVECLSRHRVHKTAVWRDKVNNIGAATASRLLSDCGVSATALCAALLLSEQPSTQQSQYAENLRLIDQAHELNAGSLVVITGGIPRDMTLTEARSMATDNLAQLVAHASDAGVMLCLEPLHPMVCGLRSVISTLQEATDMIEQINRDDVLGLVVDTYALWWQSDLESAILRAGNRIRHLHVSDWLANTRDIRLDRGMPGDGIINNREIRQWIEATGFDGPVEVEIFSKLDWWHRPADEVVSTILDRYTHFL